MIQQPYDLFKPGWADQYVVGMINQVAQAMDDFITSQVIVYIQYIMYSVCARSPTRNKEARPLLKPPAKAKNI